MITKGFVGFPIKNDNKISTFITKSQSKDSELSLKETPSNKISKNNKDSAPSINKFDNYSNKKDRITNAINKLKRNNEFNVKRTKFGILEDKERDRMVSKSPDIKLRS